MKEDKDYIYYDPVAGMTILQAIMTAIRIAQENKKPVKTNLNDVDMVITDKTSPKDALIVFHKRLDEIHAQQIKQSQKQR